ncbi:MAG: hypothetical protein ACLURV_11150 [Gallintestinimicrobium sp.]
MDIREITILLDGCSQRADGMYGDGTADFRRYGNLDMLEEGYGINLIPWRLCTKDL